MSTEFWKKLNADVLTDAVIRITNYQLSFNDSSVFTGVIKTASIIPSGSYDRIDLFVTDCKKKDAGYFDGKTIECPNMTLNIKTDGTGLCITSNRIFFDGNYGPCEIYLKEDTNTESA